MVPKVKEKAKEENIYDYCIKFTLMGKKFSFIMKVDNTRRT